MALLIVGGTIAVLLAATLGLPLQDGRVAAADQALGFDWSVACGWVAAHPTIGAVLRFAYLSLNWQPLVAVLYCEFANHGKRLGRFYRAAIAGLAVTIVLFAAFPTLGPDPVGIQRHILLRLRAHEWPGGLYGAIVSFPSYHTVMAVLLIWLFWTTRLRWPAFALNGTMLCAITVMGDHFLVDEIAGFFIAAVVLCSSRAMISPAWRLLQRLLLSDMQAAE